MERNKAKNPKMMGVIKPANRQWAIDKMDQLLDNNLNFMYGEDWLTEENNKKFWNYNTKLDNIRDEDMERQLPELYNAMKKYKV